MADPWDRTGPFVAHAVSSTWDHTTAVAGTCGSGWSWGLCSWRILEPGRSIKFRRRKIGWTPEAHSISTCIAKPISTLSKPCHTWKRPNTTGDYLVCESCAAFQMWAFQKSRIGEHPTKMGHPNCFSMAWQGSCWTSVQLLCCKTYSTWIWDPRLEHPACNNPTAAKTRHEISGSFRKCTSWRPTWICTLGRHTTTHGFQSHHCRVCPDHWILLAVAGWTEVSSLERQ